MSEPMWALTIDRCSRNFGSSDGRLSAEGVTDNRGDQPPWEPASVTTGPSVSRMHTSRGCMAPICHARRSCTPRRDPPCSVRGWAVRDVAASIDDGAVDIVRRSCAAHVDGAGVVGRHVRARGPDRERFRAKVRDDAQVADAAHPLGRAHGELAPGATVVRRRNALDRPAQRRRDGLLDARHVWVAAVPRGLLRRGAIADTAHGQHERRRRGRERQDPTHEIIRDMPGSAVPVSVPALIGRRRSPTP